MNEQKECSTKHVMLHLTDDSEFEEDEQFLFVLEAVSFDEEHAKVALGFDRLFIRIPQNDGIYYLFHHNLYCAVHPLYNPFLIQLHCQRTLER